MAPLSIVHKSSKISSNEGRPNVSIWNACQVMRANSNRKRGSGTCSNAATSRTCAAATSPRWLTNCDEPKSSCDIDAQFSSNVSLMLAVLFSHFCTGQYFPLDPLLSLVVVIL